MPKNKPKAGDKTYGSAYQKCPLKGKKQAAIQVLVVDPQKAPVFGMKVSGTDKTPTKNEAPTDDQGLVTLKPFIPGPLDLELTFDDNEKKIWLDPRKAMGVAKAGKSAGYHLFVLKPLIKRISPKIVYDDDRLEVNPKAKTSAALGVTLSMTQSHPEVDLDVDGELTRSGPEIELYTDQGLTAAVAFAGDKATLPSADIKQPKKYWIKGTALARATLVLKGVPLNAGKLNLDLEHEYTEGVTLFAPEAKPEIVKIDPTFMPGKDRKITIGCHISDVHKMASDCYIEIADKDGTVAWTSPKKTFPGDKTDNNNYDFQWDGKGTSGDIVPNDKGPYKVRFIITDKYDRKPQDETELAIIKPGTITAIFDYAQIAKDAGKDKASRTGIKVKATGFGSTGGEATTGDDGKAKIEDLPPGDYAVTATLSDDLGKDYELLTARKDADELKEGANVDLPFEIDPLSTLKVTLKSGDKSLKDATIKLNGKVVENKNIFGDDGTIDFGPMPPDRYTIEITYPDDHALWDTYHAPETITVDLLRGQQLKQDVPAKELPAMTVTVLCKKPDKKLEGAKVKIKKDGGKEITADTTADGKATFAHVPVASLKINIELKDQNAKDFEIPAEVAYMATEAGPNAKEIEVVPKKCPVHIKPMLKMPDDKLHGLPKDYKIWLILDDDVQIQCKLNDKGVLILDNDKNEVPKAPRIQKFTVQLQKAENSYLVCEKDGDPESAELIKDDAPAFGTKLYDAMQAGKRALLLPQVAVKLIQLDTEADPADNYTAPNFDFKDKEIIGAADTPVKLTIKPKWQYIRFEYFDRRNAKAKHSSKRVGVPPVLLKAGRRTNAGFLDAVETASSFQLNPTDNATSCQALPWWLVKKPDGAPQDKLDKRMHLEFGVANAWIEAKSDTERKIIKLDPVTDKAKIEPHKDRDLYYDLPSTWKSLFYYTRLSATTGKFFDALTETDIEGSYDKAKPLTFSLDDIVLTTSAGSQAVKDKRKTGGNLDLSEHSRMAVLFFNPDKKYDINVHDPEDNGFFSKTRFAKDAADIYCNYIIDYPINPRAIIFCNECHHIATQRTTNADFGKREIWGARAARIDDPAVGLRKTFESAADVNAGYVHRTRTFTGFYLHYGATDGTTVYHGLVSHWCTRIFVKNADKPPGWSLTDGPVSNNLADLRNYRDEGMKRAMGRWNGKSYQFEQADKKTDVVVKPFFLFEVKDVEAPAGTFNAGGGKVPCITGIGTDAKGSWATDTELFMRRSGYKDEGEDWGDPPNEVLPADYALPGTPRCALAHELGHAVVGVWDDYITQKQHYVPSYKEEQRYPGVPYFRDVASIMSPNQTVRLRQMWSRVRLLNELGKAGGDLNKFLSATKFAAVYAPPGKDKLIYELPDTVNSFWQPAWSEEVGNDKLGEKGKSKLHLYPMGTDEFSALMPDGPYDAMLVIDTRIEVIFKKGLEDKPKDWKTGDAYNLGDVADCYGDYCVCNENHTAGTFDTDLGAFKWIKIDLDAAEKDYTFGTNYTKGDRLKKGGKLYVARKDFKAGELTDTHWITKGGQKGNWATGQAYVTGDVVQSGADKYVCQTGHTAGGAFEGGNFIKIVGPITTYAVDRDISLGNQAKESGSATVRVCKQAHKSGPDAEIQAERLVEAKVKEKDWPGVAQKRDFLGELNKGITQQVEGPKTEGKLRFSRESKPYSKIYIRSFPQFFELASNLDDTGTPEAANGGAAHFVVIARFTESKGFGATGSDVKVSTKVKPQTFTKYILGKLSETPATRDTQKPEDDLAVGDLDKIKAWVDGKITGTATDAEKLDEIPKVDSFTPAKASIDDTVTITGDRFTGATKVTFGTVDQTTITVASATSITCKVPAGTVRGRIRVSTPKGRGSAQTDLQIVPKVTAIAPTTPVKVETEATLTGTSFNGVIEVKVNGKVAKFTKTSDTEIKVTVPADATTGKVYVANPDGGTTSDAELKIHPVPKLDSFTPASAKKDDEVTLTGTGLDITTEVKIGGVVATIVSKTATTVKAKVGDGAASGKVEVTTEGGTANKDGFTLAT